MSKKNKSKKIKLNLRYVFSDKEKQELGKTLGEAQLELSRQDNDLKRIQADFKAKIAATEARIQTLASSVTSGYEFRDIECEVVYNSPRNGVKTCSRLDTKEVVWTEEMTQEELQEKLDLDPESE